MNACNVCVCARARVRACTSQDLMRKGYEQRNQYNASLLQHEADGSVRLTPCRQDGLRMVNKVDPSYACMRACMYVCVHACMHDVLYLSVWSSSALKRITRDAPLLCVHIPVCGMYLRLNDMACLCVVCTHVLDVHVRVRAFTCACVCVICIHSGAEARTNNPRPCSTRSTEAYARLQPRNQNPRT